MMGKQITKAFTQDCIDKINQLRYGQNVEFLIPSFNTVATFHKGNYESTLVYKNCTVIRINHSTTTITVETRAQPYTGLFFFVLPLINRLLFARINMETGKLIID